MKKRRSMNLLSIHSAGGARGIGAALLALCMATLMGCASVQATNPRDPWESYNRSMSNINDKVDAAVLKPVATAYKAVTPPLVRTGVSNFFSNLGEPWTALNALLQLKGEAAVETVMRFSVNTVFGLGGLLDIASDMGLERQQQDFGQTLGRWGVPSGPYFVLPIYGPSTVRDAAAFSIETQADPISQQTNLTVKDTLTILRALELRASLLRAGNVLEEAALDKYTFTRDIFLQRRDNLVFDGREPPDPDAQVDKPPAK
jgi:phospholipid-binding lipoprotein MlaA